MISETPYSSTLLGIETANPPNKLSQQDVLEGIIKYVRPSSSALGLYHKFLSDKGISTRHFAWDDMPALLAESPDEKMKRFEYWAVRLAVSAAEAVLKKCRSSVNEIDALFVSTCTGYLCPGLSTYIIQQLGLRENIYHLDLVGLGCVGALPALRAADDFLKNRPGSKALVIAVEICSAAIHWDERPELILSNSIFSDGAAAGLVASRREAGGLHIKSISSLLWPQFRDELRFKYMDARLCNVISPKVSEIARQAVGSLYKEVDTDASFVFHPGGRKVLDAIAKHLNLSEFDMEPSRRILKEYGNMSSPSVLFSLKSLMDQPFKDSRRIVCFSFGAGFSAAILYAQWQASA